MKKFTLVMASLLMLFTMRLNAQNQRVLLFECFTNTSCGPCASQNPALDALIHSNPGHIAAIKYHMSWPGANDPMYLHNTGDNNARRSVYEVNSVPHTVVDGIRFGNVPSGLSQSMVNNWLAIESPIEMRLSYEVDAAANTITATKRMHIGFLILRAKSSVFLIGERSEKSSSTCLNSRIRGAKILPINLRKSLKCFFFCEARNFTSYLVSIDRSSFLYDLII